MLDTLVHNQTALLAGVARKIAVNEVILGTESGFEENHKVIFNVPRTVDYRANVQDIAKYLLRLMEDERLRAKLGKAARKHVVKNFDYRVVAQRFVNIIREKFEIE